VTLDTTVYNVETPTFTPGIQTITYTNDGFSGYTLDPVSFAQVPLGSFGDISYNIYATPVTFNINITKNASISTFNYDVTKYTVNSTINTYNVLDSDIPIQLNDIVVTNQLYLSKANTLIGTVTTGSIYDQTFALESPLKINSISIGTLPTGYASSVLSASTYTATNTAVKDITLTHTMDPGYSQPTADLTVSGIYDDMGSSVSVSTLNNRAFTIPVGS